MKQPGFSGVAIITLALGIGANTSIFSVVNGVLLRPLPFTESERLVLVWNRGAEAAGGDRTPLCVADLFDWRAQNRSFESIGAFQELVPLNYAGGEIPEQVRAANVTTNFFSLLGVNVQLGRDFQANDEQLGAPRVVLLSDHFWRSHFGADKQIVGRTINLNGVDNFIVGVMPGNLNFPAKDVELWSALQPDRPTRRGPYFLTGIARLKPGTRVQQARADTPAMKSSFDGKHFDFNILSINDYIVGDVRLTLVALLAAVTLVLLIAVVNVANLTLVRAATRVKEFSIRTALGASRSRIACRLLTESLLLSLAGGVLGTLCALWSIALLVKLAPESLPRIDEIRIDAFVLGWTTLVSLLTGVIFGLAPAWQSSRMNLIESLRDGGRSSTESMARKRWRSALVVTELALAVMLMISAGLVVKSLWRLQQVDTGINPERVLTMHVSLRGQKYQELPQVRSFYARLLEETQAIPGVRATAVSNSLPPEDTEFSSDFTIEGAAHQAEQIAYFTKVSPDYFRALGITLRDGRFFNQGDSTNAPQVALINETFQRRFFSSENPIGKRLNLGSSREPDWNQIMGVVGDVKYNGLAEDVQPAIYLAAEQSPARSMSLIVKTGVPDPLSLAGAVRNEIRILDPDLPAAQVSTMNQRLANAMAQPRFRSTLIALFAGVALILACVGIYGVVSYSVTQRTQEIGIRMALGAQKGNVLKLVIGQALMLAFAGVALGLTAAFGLSRMMSSLLFGVKPTDTPTYVGTAVLLMATALVASFLPARRATKVDPLVALRYE